MMDEEVTQRFVICDTPPDLTGSGVHSYHSRHWGDIVLTRIHAYRSIHLEASKNQTWKTNYNLRYLPPLTVLASNLPPAVLTYLAGKGIVPSATDTITNVLRALRNLKENGDTGFDISD